LSKPPRKLLARSFQPAECKRPVLVPCHTPKFLGSQARYDGHPDSTGAGRCR
jgi:hypothetical protein